MAKAIRLYIGSDSYGRSVEVAQREDGAWFSRDYRWNGYGMGWSKWQREDSAPEHPATVRCMSEYAGSPEFVEIPEDQRIYRIEWGFNVLRLCEIAPRCRLPSPAYD